MLHGSKGSKGLLNAVLLLKPVLLYLGGLEGAGRVFGWIIVLWFVCVPFIPSETPSMFKSAKVFGTNSIFGRRAASSFLKLNI